MSAGTLRVRLKRGIVGERERVVHTVVVPEDAPVVDTVTTVCLKIFSRDRVDVLTNKGGMPCIACVSRMAASSASPSGEQASLAVRRG